MQPYTAHSSAPPFPQQFASKPAVGAGAASHPSHNSMHHQNGSSSAVNGSPYGLANQMSQMAVGDQARPPMQNYGAPPARPPMNNTQTALPNFNAYGPPQMRPPAPQQHQGAPSLQHTGQPLHSYNSMSGPPLSHQGAMPPPPPSSQSQPSSLPLQHGHPSHHPQMQPLRPPGPPTMPGSGMPPRPMAMGQSGPPPTSLSNNRSHPPPTSQYNNTQPSYPGPPLPGMSSQMPPPQPGMGYSQPPTMGPPQPGMAPPQPGLQSRPNYPATSMSGPPTGPAYGAPPGSNPNYGSGPAAPAPGPPAAKRLDPDQMPSVIQVVEDDRKAHSGLFETGQRGQVPPLVTTDFVTVDQGNCSPRFVRSTMYSVPCTGDMLKQSHLPFGLVVSPLAERLPDEGPMYISDLGSCGPVRCIRCKAYMSPYMTWIDGGRRFQCALCGGSTETPEAYFAHLDHTGRRVDTYNRPELHLGSYELVATAEYCKGSVLPNVPAIVFMIDVSYNAMRSGLVNLICSSLKDSILPYLPKEEGMDTSDVRVGFVTYDRVIHYYNLNPKLSQPQMMVISDLEDVFVPLVDGFLVNPTESEVLIEQLMEMIPVLFKDTTETEVVLGPVIASGVDALKSAQCPGKLILFHTSLPTAEAPGKLKNRDERKLLGTDKEKSILTPSSTYYTTLGQQCVEAGVGVDLFLCCNSYLDFASIGSVPFMSGGSAFKYTYFQAENHGEQLLSDLRDSVSRTTAFDCVMRIRTSAGTRPVEFFGGMYMANTTDVETGCLDSEKSIACEIKHDDKLNEGEPVLIQVALLYTSVSGQRRLRIHNLALNSTNQMADVFRSGDLDTMMNLMFKMSLKMVLSKTPKDIREGLIDRCTHILAAYRKHCANPSAPGQLILPEVMKLLPLFSNCIIKNDAIQGGSEISTDDRSFLMATASSMSVAASHAFLYPRLLPLHNLTLEDVREVPLALRCSVDRLQQDGVYLLENGVVMFIWIGQNVNPQWIVNVFGVQSPAQINVDKTELMEFENPASQRVRRVIELVREQRRRHMKFFIVRARDKLEPWFNEFLVEDRSMKGASSYVDFLCHVHKEIQNLLS